MLLYVVKNQAVYSVAATEQPLLASPIGLVSPLPLPGIVRVYACREEVQGGGVNPSLTNAISPPPCI